MQRQSGNTFKFSNSPVCGVDRGPRFNLPLLMAFLKSNKWFLAARKDMGAAILLIFARRLFLNRSVIGSGCLHYTHRVSETIFIHKTRKLNLYTGPVYLTDVGILPTMSVAFSKRKVANMFPATNFRMQQIFHWSLPDGLKNCCERNSTCAFKFVQVNSNHGWPSRINPGLDGKTSVC